MIRDVLRSAVTALFLCLCGAALAEEPIVFGHARVTVEMASGATYAFSVEVATTPSERARGLMERKSLDPDAGMIFDFGIERDVLMWMKDTPLPLDMLFIAADGSITKIAQNTVPYSEDIISSGGRVRYVVEINGGRAAELGISPGDRLSLEK